MTDARPTSNGEQEQGGEAGVAPVDAVVRARWPVWKTLLAYIVLGAVAVGSVWFIDDHVLAAVDPATTSTAPTVVGR